jgi:hypothetical protein
MLMYEKATHNLNVNWRNSSVLATALMLSCNSCDLPVVRMLLARPNRAEPRLYDRYHKTALMYACEHNTEGSVAIIAEVIVSFLSVLAVLAVLSVFLEGCRCLTDFAQLYRCRNLEILTGEPTFAARKSLLEMVDVCQWSCLHYAAKSGVLARFPWGLLGGKWCVDGSWVVQCTAVRSVVSSSFVVHLNSVHRVTTTVALFRVQTD